MFQIHDVMRIHLHEDICSDLIKFEMTLKYKTYWTCELSIIKITLQNNNVFYIWSSDILSDLGYEYSIYIYFNNNPVYNQPHT